ncbi:MAG: hypothetical protein IH595_00505 [Bacteroidales bacterium]|nr:hypothetical protein [Bacteroidales bacterium]
MLRLKLYFIFTLILAAIDTNAQTIGSQAQQPGQKLVVSNIFIKGNKITKNYIILREIEVKKGDTVSEQKLIHRLKESRYNLLNRKLFNFVDLKPVVVDSNKVNIYVSVVERWYIWPIPIIKYTDLNFNVWWQKKEISRIDYGISVRVNNFRGRMENLFILLQNGYNKSLQLAWDDPYINKKETWGIGFNAGAVINHEVDYKNVNNRLLYFGEPFKFVKKNMYLTLMATYRPGYKQLHSFYISYNYFNFSDTLFALNPSFAYKYSVFSYLSLRYNFRLDYRDYAPYPLDGYYLEVDLNQNGLGLLKSGVNYFYAYAIYDRYFTIRKPWYFAYNVTLSAEPNRYRPYFLEKGLGYPPTTLRGYQLYVVNGQWMVLFHSNLKYELIPKKIVQVPFIHSEKFGKLFYSVYANLIFDAGYVADHISYTESPLSNKFIYGTGLGLDFVTYYDMVFGIEYTINRQNQKNFFISLVAPI